MGDGRMRQREAQQRFVLELAAKALLEFGEIGHG